MNSIPPPETIYVLNRLAAGRPSPRALAGRCTRYKGAGNAGECATHPAFDDILEFIGGHSGVRSHYELHHSLFTAGCERFHIAVENCLEWLLMSPLRMLRSQRPNTV